jgi:hypothetical protein
MRDYAFVQALLNYCGVRPQGSEGNAFLWNLIAVGHCKVGHSVKNLGLYAGFCYS